MKMKDDIFELAPFQHHILGAQAKPEMSFGTRIINPSGGQQP